MGPYTMNEMIKKRMRYFVSFYQCFFIPKKLILKINIMSGFDFFQ